MYFGCGINESFYETYTQIIETANKYFIYAKTDFGNITNITDDSSDYFDRQLCSNCTITDCPEVSITINSWGNVSMETNASQVNTFVRKNVSVDQYIDAMDHTSVDEMECPISICKYDERKFPCHDSHKCIFRSQLCDGFANCFDHSDELYCADLALPWKH